MLARSCFYYIIWGRTALTGRFSEFYNHEMNDTIHLNVYQTITANTKNISVESKAFAEKTLAKVISLVEVEEAIAA